MRLRQKLGETDQPSTTLGTRIMVETDFLAEREQKFILHADRNLFSSQK